MKRNWKSKIMILLAAALLAIVTACSSGQKADGGTNASESEKTGQNQNQKIKLRATSFVPRAHGAFGQLDPWMERVTRESNGQVEFEVFTSGELVPAGKSYDSLKSGIADVDLTFLPSYEPSRFPLTEVTQLPLSYSTTEIASTAFRKLVESDVPIKDGKTYYQLEFEDKGLVGLPAVTTQQYVISTTGKTVESVKDFSKLSLRSASRVHEFFLKNVGANSITMPSTDLYEALSRNALDGSILSVADWQTYGFEELFKYTLQGINLGHYAHVTAMTQEKWNSLPAHIQELMRKTYYETAQDGINGWEERAQKGISVYESRGGVFVDFSSLPSEVQEHLMKAMEKTWHDWIEAMEKEGHPGLAMARLWRDLIIEAGGKVPEGVQNL